MPARDGGEPRWYEISQSPGAGGETVGFALDADDLVAAEASLRRFVETLTETFAHLPIGLAVFDKNRRLGLFNPALTDLVKIDAVWLAGRPSLRDFLERLRETRQMPEQKDFASWRRKLSELEEGAREGTYEENWQLPSGKIFRVTGRPHPQGALAFLFEDISTAIQLERKYRSELELSQATLDRMSEAVAVFDASGMLVFVNSAFERLWGLDPMERLDGPGVARDDRALGRALRAEPGLGAARRVRHRRRGAHQLDRGGRDPRRASRCDCWSRRCPTPRRWWCSATLRRRADAARRRRSTDARLRAARLPAEAAVQKLRGGDPGRAVRRRRSRCSAAAAQGLKDGARPRARARGWPARRTPAAARSPASPRRSPRRGCRLDAAAPSRRLAPELRRRRSRSGSPPPTLAAPGARGSRSPRDGAGHGSPRAAGGARRPAAPRASGVALARRLVEAAGGSSRSTPRPGSPIAHRRRCRADRSGTLRSA